MHKPDNLQDGVLGVVGQADMTPHDERLPCICDSECVVHALIHPV